LIVESLLPKWASSLSQVPSEWVALYRSAALSLNACPAKLNPAQTTSNGLLEKGVGWGGGHQTKKPSH